MKASAQILIQRYLDGDLSELELQAFLEDLSRNRELASMLEREVKLDAAVINDAYSIEPPAELRASILNVISTSETNWFGTAAGRATFGLAVSGLLLLTSFVGIGTDSERHAQSASAPAAQSAAPAAASGMTQRTQPDLRPSASIAAGVAQAPSSSTTDADDVISEIVIEPTSPLHEQFETLTRPLRDQPSVAVWGMSAPFGTSLPAGLFAGMVGTTAASLRYELDVLEGSQVFVEAGGLKQSRTSTVYVNDVAASTIASGFTPYLSIGVSGTVVDLDMLGRSIEGAASIGVTSAGPIAMVDLSAPLFDFGTGTLDVGLRTSALFDVGSGQRVHVNAAPFIRVDISLR
jgi:hypothetical protein